MIRDQVHPLAECALSPQGICLPITLTNLHQIRMQWLICRAQYPDDIMPYMGSSMFALLWIFHSETRLLFSCSGPWCLWPQWSFEAKQHCSWQLRKPFYGANRNVTIWKKTSCKSAGRSHSGCHLRSSSHMLAYLASSGSGEGPLFQASLPISIC